jgi:hypothetical protein
LRCGGHLESPCSVGIYVVGAAQPRGCLRHGPGWAAPQAGPVHDTEIQPVEYVVPPRAARHTRDRAAQSREAAGSEPCGRHQSHCIAPGGGTDLGVCPSHIELQGVVTAGEQTSDLLVVASSKPNRRVAPCRGSGMTPPHRTRYERTVLLGSPKSSSRRLHRMAGSHPPPDLIDVSR